MIIFLKLKIYILHLLIVKDSKLFCFYFILVDVLGIKPLLPPYADPNLQLEDLLTGVNFASGGAGFDPLTSKTAVYNYTLSFHLIITMKSLGVPPNFK